MILVTVGTQTMSFFRLLNEVQSLVENQVITSEVIIQSGHTTFNFNHKNIKVIEFIPSEELMSMQAKAEFIITHGGVGSILEALVLRKKIIAVPRLKKYGEHINDHQLEIVDIFSKLGYILPVYDIDTLATVIGSIEEFTPEKFESTKSNVVSFLKATIDNW